MGYEVAGSYGTQRTVPTFSLILHPLRHQPSRLQALIRPGSTHQTPHNKQVHTSLLLSRPLPGGSRSRFDGGAVVVVSGAAGDAALIEDPRALLVPPTTPWLVEQ